MAKRTCDIDGCEGTHFGRGLCNKHYQRWRDHGHTGLSRPSALERLVENIDRSDPGGCWTWTGVPSGSGYGAFLLDGKQTTAHRAAFVLLVGDVDDTKQIDHLCRNRLCVRPDHLEAVSPQENVRRAKSTKQRCPQGHPYAGDNLFVTKQGWRQCRKCRNESKRISARRRRARMEPTDG